MIIFTLFTMCQSNFSSRKPCLRAFVSVNFGYFNWLFSTKSLGTKKTKALKMGFLVWKLFWNIVNKVNIIKNGYSKKNFQIQNQLFRHSQNTKLAFSQKVIGEKKLYPHFLHWFIILHPSCENWKTILKLLYKFNSRRGVWLTSM